MTKLGLQVYEYQVYLPLEHRTLCELSICQVVSGTSFVGELRRPTNLKASKILKENGQQTQQLRKQQPADKLQR